MEVSMTKPDFKLFSTLEFSYVEDPKVYRDMFSSKEPWEDGHYDLDPQFTEVLMGTGLLDKEGNQIFEGDVLRKTRGRTDYTVVYNHTIPYLVTEDDTEFSLDKILLDGSDYKIKR